MSRLIVVSNRVAVPEAGKVSAGGLAVAVNAALKERSGIWFGWSGKITEQPSDQPAISMRNGVKYAVVDLKEDDYQEYYNGFANRVLWPILHYRVDLAEFVRSDLSGYIRVNKNFAEHVSKIIEEDDIIWVHDYHMMPLARYLRERGHKNRIGFFLHIPLPPPDLIQALPRHGEIVGSLVHYDLVGFQTESDRDNFGRYLEGRGARPGNDGTSYEIAGRRVRIGAFPVAIETESFARRARHAMRTNFMKDFRASLTGKKMVLGVDRLDYSKGIPNRLEAFETLLRTAPEWHERVTFVQITPKSRTSVPEYAEMDRYVSTKAGQINGEFGDVSWTPLRYVNKTYSRSALAGLYRAADVAMVTPLRDGMNLVAKEFVAAQDPEDPGVLLLSQFAGAAAEMGGGALMVNPHEVEGVASALRRALEMPLAERRDRHARMMTVLNTNTIDHWAQNFLDALTDPPALDALLSARSNGLRPSAPACLMDWQGLHRAQDL
ncbi:putative OtsA trehalose-6-phosphate synthase [Azorhizobium caulinodans ORS 571]|uniref:Trehalose-6-phosphate synthase n=1 Tax=Azorhizobium caulinodans (strain ATCC 43989 / DSM 5975 / JCM 20966 / LMG 6465 / NBRC 14845 / NCIMB 13405 / ORS 571) TaxID=438753 RepID=A8IM42_AZOC5|nr:alpha,alpha-trehalose-phosphate synthase (UDP-forming) [Azorhizobium caulinodans]BAF86480.1 putative OtsA trehalose-6-phosphate synthase [Azorhizobium caulinodans ORS 571]